MPAVETSGRVQLEGSDEAYATWAEVEDFLLPETLLSMDDTESDEEDYQEDLESSFNALDISDGTSISSTHSVGYAPKTPESPDSVCTDDTGLYSQKDAVLRIESPDQTAHNSESHERPTSVESPKLGNGSAYSLKAHLETARPLNPKASIHVMRSPNPPARNSTEVRHTEKAKPAKSAVPTYLQPLFNHILWRIHKETNPDAALESFILLTNDPTKQNIAPKFGIRAKRLEQLRDAVAREEREFRNRMTVYKLESGESKPRVVADKSNENKTPSCPKSSHSSHSKEDIDSEDEDDSLLKRAPRGPQAQMKGQRVLDPNDFGRANQGNGSRGGRGGFKPPRGRGSPRGGRGGFAARGAYAPSGPPFRVPPAPRHDPNQPIDPNSFTRPIPRASPMRGARRKLWEPN
ncbi:hypothetical protein K504DRAFT_467459 [Pleomassaria siparia CBS 279.74]|uniref:Uncharacterized protein n=1 Tax=Pleomassaria siparia CBS 279.74 TaxID=1314801 RepID=A0A6G1KAM4_9PLEO|nr:hypothetical protein K504DRAFT_467459 [Pleomassaria siparia CBS 279.74]